MGSTEKIIKVLLRIGGAITVAAFPAMLLPVEWMAETHAWLGLGEYPRAPVVEYLARSIAALYGFHGVLLLLISTDVRKYRPLVFYAGAMNVLFGSFLLAIDWSAGMPGYWTVLEGPPIVVFGLVILYLTRGLRTE